MALGLGNYAAFDTGAHYDPMDTVDVGDAQQLIDFIRELLNYLYVLPWELNARRATKPSFQGTVSRGR